MMEEALTDLVTQLMNMKPGDKFVGHSRRASCGLDVLHRSTMNMAHAIFYNNYAVACVYHPDKGTGVPELMINVWDYNREKFANFYSVYVMLRHVCTKLGVNHFEVRDSYYAYNAYMNSGYRALVAYKMGVEL